MLATALLICPCARGQGGVFDLGNRRAERAVVTVSEAPPPVETRDSTMLQLLSGVIASLRGQDLVRLRACVPQAPFLGDPTRGERVCVVHLYGARDREAPAKSVEILRTPGPTYVALERNTQSGQPQRAELDRDATAALLRAWALYRGGFDQGACTDPRAEVFEIPKPYEPGAFVMDKPTMGRRFMQRGTTNLGAADRDLASETLYARLPRGYDPRTPAGLLVWINAMPNGRPPEAFTRALDDLGILCVGAADSGNERRVENRYQLAFDAVATACRRWHIDPRRVYVTGISGGGRVSSQLLGCFPEVFTGAVPIVGLSHYESVPTGTGSAWPAGYARPDGPVFRLFTSRPMGVITGTKDFNQREIENATHLMRKDGLDVRVFQYDEMGHEMPTPERFADAMEWVDRVYQEARREESEAARAAMETYVQRFKGEPPKDAAARKLLVRVTEVGPWTEPAWRAVELLRSP